MHLDNPTLYVLIGISGSGKSTYAEKLRLSKELAVVSTDAIRQEMLGSEENQSAGAEIFGCAYRRINQHLSCGQDVVFDATNTTQRGRNQLLRAIEQPCKKVAVLLTPPLDVALAQNIKRLRNVPESVVRRQYAQLIRDGESILDQFKNICFVKGE